VPDSLLECDKFALGVAEDNKGVLWPACDVTSAGLCVYYACWVRCVALGGVSFVARARAECRKKLTFCAREKGVNTWPSISGPGGVSFWASFAHRGARLLSKSVLKHFALLRERGVVHNTIYNVRWERQRDSFIGTRDSLSIANLFAHFRTTSRCGRRRSPKDVLCFAQRRQTQV
jgi:hypothetical protein